MFGLPELVLLRGVRQTSTDTDSELLSVVLSSSQLRSNPVMIRRSSTGSDYCLVACGGQAAIVGLGGIAPFPA